LSRVKGGAAGSWTLLVGLGLGTLGLGTLTPGGPGEASDSVEDELTGMRFRWVAAGTAVLGSPEGEPGRRSGEALRTIEVTRGFWLGETEVTHRQWSLLLPGRPSYFDACGDDCPVERVNWFEAALFANRLSERSGLELCYELEECSGQPGSGCSADSARKCDGDYTCRLARSKGPACLGFRLPTSAEWEWAARAGSKSAIYTGDLEIVSPNNSPALDAIAWYAGNSGVDYSGAQDCSDWAPKQHPAERCGAHPVGRKLANDWGLHDVLGNVWEWVEDRVDWSSESGGFTSTADIDGAVDPIGDQGSKREMRGCSWYNFAAACRSAQRGSSPPATRVRTVGFRLARTSQPSPPVDDD
jgi:formylglycine-generating enzyme required for sulfatase activity